jgi:hypothetical protein
MSAQELDITIENGFLAAVKYFPDTTEVATALATQASEIAKAQIQAEREREAERQDRLKANLDKMQDLFKGVVQAEADVRDAEAALADAKAALAAFDYDGQLTLIRKRVQLELDLEHAESNYKRWEEGPEPRDENKGARLKQAEIEAKERLNSHNLQHPELEEKTEADLNQDYKDLQDAVVEARKQLKDARLRLQRQRNLAVLDAAALAAGIPLNLSSVIVPDETTPSEIRDEPGGAVPQGPEWVAIPGPLLYEIVENPDCSELELKLVDWFAHDAPAGVPQITLSAKSAGVKQKLAFAPAEGDTCPDPQETCEEQNGGWPNACEVSAVDDEIKLAITLSAKLGDGTIGEGREVVVVGHDPLALDDPGQANGYFQLDEKKLTVVIRKALFDGTWPERFELSISDEVDQISLCVRLN